MLIDTHSHPYLEEFDEDRDDVMRRAAEAGVGHIILPNVDLNTVAPMRTLHERWRGMTSMAMGLHPTEVGESWRDDLAAIEDEWSRRGDEYVAVGEVGIDLYWDKTFAEQQMQVFDRQVAMAVERDLPVIIHCREGLDRALEVLSGYSSPPAAVFHSFGGTTADVDRVRRIGDFYFGINGIVTFKNCRLSDSLDAIGRDRLLLETDAPYLAPVPNRGKRNEPAFVALTAAHVARCLGMTADEVALVTSANARDLFKILKWREASQKE